MIDSKHATESVGMWGLFILMAAQVANQVLGVEIKPEEQQVMVDAYGMAIQAYTNAASVLGAVMAIFGRMNAKKPVHFLTPYSVDEAGRKVAVLKNEVKDVPGDVAARMASTTKPAA